MERKAFVAGADISEFANFTVDNGGKLAAKGQELCYLIYIENFSKPVIAAINGFALGGGFRTWPWLVISELHLIMQKWGYPKCLWV